MVPIRSLQREDLPAVATLLKTTLPGWARGESFLAETLLDHPWAGDDPPSLVALSDQDEVVGFMGAQARPLLFDDRELRGVCASQLAVDPEHRGSASGALLIRKLLSGPQDLTWVDNATDLVTRIWRTFGGAVDVARASDWMLVLRPARWVGGLVGAVAGRGGLRRRLAPVAAIPFHAAGRRMARRAFPERDPNIAGSDATAGDIIEHLPALTGDVRLRVDYGTTDLEQQLGWIEAVAGNVVCRLVRAGDRPVGWYAYLPRSLDSSRVLHVSALDAHVGGVVAELIEHARAQGCSALSGRLEPHLIAPMRDRVAALGLGVQPLYHTHDAEVAATLATRLSLLTELDSVDSTWWYRSGPSD